MQLPNSKVDLPQQTKERGQDGPKKQGKARDHTSSLRRSPQGAQQEAQIVFDEPDAFHDGPRFRAASDVELADADRVGLRKELAGEPDPALEPVFIRVQVLDRVLRGAILDGRTRKSRIQKRRGALSRRGCRLMH